MEGWMDDVGCELSSARSDITYTDMAAKLITDKMLLSALELHLELIENGKELPSLTQFFSNPANFESQARNHLTPTMQRSSSQATLDSLDLTRCSEDGERTEGERLAVLEFELRKAHEKINSLRATLTQATECREGESGEGEGESCIWPVEQRALNYLVNEYLLSSGYKLTAITFADQNEHQDFEDWEDVGLNVGKPASLLHLYRTSGYRSAPTHAASTQTTHPEPSLHSFDSLVKENDELKERLLVSQREKLELVLDCEERLEGVDAWTQCDAVECDSATEYNAVECEAGTGCDRGVQTDKLLTKEALDRLQQAANNLKHISYNNGFEREIAGEMCRLEPWDLAVGDENLVMTLATLLTTLLPSLTTLTQEVVEVVVQVVVLHPDPRQRDELVQCLLNLKKRPLQQDRDLIVSGLVRVARGCECEGIIESSLLPQCWDLMTSKYLEKRLLVVEILTHISLYVSSELRDSLLVSVLQQLLGDKEESVRAASVSALALIAASISDPHKYLQIEELTMKALNDRSSVVSEATLRYLLPVVGRWALSSDRLMSHLLPSLLALLESQIQSGGVCEYGVRGLSCLLPHLVVGVASDEAVLTHMAPDLPPPQTRGGFSVLCTGLYSPVLFYTARDGETVGSIMRAFDHCTRTNMTWPSLDYLTHTMLPRVLELVERVEETNEPLLLHFVQFFKHLFAGFGHYLLQNQIKEIFTCGVEKVLVQLMDVGQPVPRLALIPVFVLALLAPLQVCTGEEVGEWLEKLVMAVCVGGAPPTVLLTVFRHAARSSDLLEPVLAALWKGVVERRREVRERMAELMSQVLPCCSDQVVAGRVLPALVTLAADPTPEVRVSALPTFGLIINQSNNKEVVDKVLVQVESVVADPALLVHHQSLLVNVRSLPAIAASCPQPFREQVILVNLSKYVEKLGETRNQTCRTELCAALVDAYSNIVYTSISSHSLATLLSPLRELGCVCGEVLPSHKDTVIQMERDVQARSTPTPRSSSGPSSPIGTEDMRVKMSKIFTSPPNIPNLPSFFKKKP